MGDGGCMFIVVNPAIDIVNYYLNTRVPDTYLKLISCGVRVRVMVKVLTLTLTLTVSDVIVAGVSDDVINTDTYLKQGKKCRRNLGQ